MAWTFVRVVDTTQNPLSGWWYVRVEFAEGAERRVEQLKFKTQPTAPTLLAERTRLLTLLNTPPPPDERTVLIARIDTLEAFIRSKGWTVP